MKEFEHYGKQNFDEDNLSVRYMIIFVKIFLL